MGSVVLGTTDDLSGKTKLVRNYLGHDMLDPYNDHMSTDTLDSCDNLIVSKTARSKGNITDNTAIPSGYDHRVNNDHGPAVPSNIHEKEQSECCHMSNTEPEPMDQNLMTRDGQGLIEDEFKAHTITATDDDEIDSEIILGNVAQRDPKCSIGSEIIPGSVAQRDPKCSIGSETIPGNVAQQDRKCSIGSEIIPGNVAQRDPKCSTRLALDAIDTISKLCYGHQRVTPQRTCIYPDIHNVTSINADITPQHMLQFPVSYPSLVKVTIDTNGQIQRNAHAMLQYCNAVHCSMFDLRAYNYAAGLFHDVHRWDCSKPMHIVSHLAACTNHCCLQLVLHSLPQRNVIGKVVRCAVPHLYIVEYTLSSTWTMIPAAIYPASAACVNCSRVPVLFQCWGDDLLIVMTCHSQATAINVSMLPDCTPLHLHIGLSHFTCHKVQLVGNHARETKLSYIMQFPNSTQAAVTQITQDAVNQVTQAAVTQITQAAVTQVTQAAVTQITQVAVNQITQAAVTQAAVTQITQAAVTQVTQAAVTQITQAAVTQVTQDITEIICALVTRGIIQVELQVSSIALKIHAVVDQDTNNPDVKYAHFRSASALMIHELTQHAPATMMPILVMAVLSYTCDAPIRTTLIVPPVDVLLKPPIEPPDVPPDPYDEPTGTTLVPPVEVPLKPPVKPPVGRVA